MPVQWFIREGTAFIALSASVFSLLAIAIERYIAITKVKVYGSNKTCRMFLLIGTCWVMSILLGGLPIIGWNCINNLGDCSTLLPLNSRYYILFVVTIFTVILLSIVILYVRIYLIVRTSTKRPPILQLTLSWRRLQSCWASSSSVGCPPSPSFCWTLPVRWNNVLSSTMVPSSLASPHWIRRWTHWSTQWGVRRWGGSSSGCFAAGAA